jgi:hypothetical protein
MKPQARHTHDAAPAGYPRAMVSYAHADETDTVGRIEQELRLRGFHVVRDMESFRAGRATEGEMADGISSNVIVAHLGPNALKSEAVIESELKPALRAYNTTGKPVVVIVPHGIGADRAEVDATIAGRLPYSANVSWGPIFGNPDPLPNDEAARIADQALGSLLGASRGAGGECWQIKVATRGTRTAAPGILVDATDLVGGHDPRPGTPEDWQRFYTGLRDLEHALRAHDDRRRVEFTLAAHLTASVAAGFAFRREWQVCVNDDVGQMCQLGDKVDYDGFDIPPVQPGTGSDERLFVEIAITGANIEQDVEAVIERTGMPRARLRIGREAGERMPSTEFAAAAAGAAQLIKNVRRQNRAKRVDLFMAAPAAFAALLGSQLNALGCPLVLHERYDDDYIETLTLDAR